jgi:hypothetical protein
MCLREVYVLVTLCTTFGPTGYFRICICFSFRLIINKVQIGQHILTFSRFLCTRVFHLPIKLLFYE